MLIEKTFFRSRSTYLKTQIPFLRRGFVNSVFHPPQCSQHHRPANFVMMMKRKIERPDLNQKSTITSFYLKPEEKERLFIIKTLLEQNPSEHYTIPQLSKKALMNEFKLKKGFKFLFGKSVYDFHLEVRMNEAKRLMRESSDTLEEIAKKIGYQYLSSFISIFKKLNEMTPATFRRRNRR